MSALKKIEEKHRPVKYDFMEYAHCPVCGRDPAPCDVVKLAWALDDILKALDAKRRLDSGERIGMGYNIVQETAARLQQYIRRAERTLEEIAGEE